MERQPRGGGAMTKKRHPSSRTSPAMRRQIQESPESNRSLARRFGVNRKTIAKWRGRSTIAEMPMGPKLPASSVLSEAEEALIVVYRKYTRLPLDDCLRRLKPMIPKLTRSNLHRCLKRYGVHRLPKGYGQKHPPPEPGESGHYSIQLHALSSGYLYSAISNSKYVFGERLNKADVLSAARFLRDLSKAAPLRLLSVSTPAHAAFIDIDQHASRQENAAFDDASMHPFLLQCCRLQITRHDEDADTCP